MRRPARREFQYDCKGRKLIRSLFFCMQSLNLSVDMIGVQTYHCATSGVADDKPIADLAKVNQLTDHGGRNCIWHIP